MSQQKKWCLSERESDVLLMVALGYCNELIAGYLKLSVQTVKSHRIELCRKLGIVDTGQLDTMIATAIFQSTRPVSELTDFDKLANPELRDRLSDATLPQLKALHDP